MHQQYKQGKVVNINHQRRFGFVEEEKTKIQYFFHFSRYGILSINQENEIIFNLGITITFPILGDILYFTEDGFLPMNPRASLWVYQIDYVAMEAELLKSKIHRERSRKPRQQRTGFRPQWSPPPPPPPPRQEKKKTWREIFGFNGSGRVTKEMVEREFKKLAMHVHPDRGGSHERMIELNAAKEEALRFTR